jgi:hypothetical protein
MMARSSSWQGAQVGRAGYDSKLRTVANHVLAVEEAVQLLAEKALQSRLALDQRERCDVVAVQEQQIEREENELVRVAFVHRRLQAAENRNSVGIEGAQLAVEIGRFDRQALQRLNRAPVAVRPVEARAGQERGLAAVDARMHAVAVVLDLVDPSVARRSFFDQARQLRLDPFRRPIGFSHDG